jgi:dihydroorotate dehydrogenase electron transfer subunit
MQLHIRGPFGKGFQLPATARFVALVSLGNDALRLLALTEAILAQRAALVLLTDRPPEGLPAAIEISRISALAETARWADYIAADLPRAVLPSFLRILVGASYRGEGQVLVETALPCGGMADCGVCAVSLRKGHQLACKDGPVFNLKTLYE